MSPRINWEKEVTFVALVLTILLVGYGLESIGLGSVALLTLVGFIGGQIWAKAKRKWFQPAREVQGRMTTT